jgi:hypothetical protein
LSAETGPTYKITQFDRRMLRESESPVGGNRFGPDKLWLQSSRDVVGK